MRYLQALGYINGLAVVISSFFLPKNRLPDGINKGVPKNTYQINLIYIIFR